MLALKLIFVPESKTISSLLGTYGFVYKLTADSPKKLILCIDSAKYIHWIGSDISPPSRQSRFPSR